VSSNIADDSTVQAIPAAPIPLDGMVYGIDGLDALLVFHLGDAHLHAAWVRADAGFRAEEPVSSLRDAYRVAQFAARRLALFGAGGGERRGEAQNPVLTIEIAQRTALLRRVRAHVVATLFDASMPLGMARLITGRLAAQLEPELPRDGDAQDARGSRPDLSTGGATDPLRGPSTHKPRLPSPSQPPEANEEREPATIAFGRRPSRPPMPRATLTELDRTRRVLMFLEMHAPEPHIVRLRLALRTGLAPLALEHPEALGAEAVVLIETAVEEILGIDAAELRSVV
jgi:hypothetical protein